MSRPPWRRRRRRRRIARALLGLALALSALAASPAPASRAAAAPDASLYRALRWRFLGPTRGGRSTVIAGVSSRPNVFFMGTAGGLWRTENAGASWANVSDPFFESSSVGAVAVADSDPDVVWAGTGQGILRGNVAAGVGVYRSADGGRTWANAGLRDAGQIARIRIDPRDPDRVYVAVVGRAFGPSAVRGVYRTTNGGRTWERVLAISPRTGATDLAIDATDPRVLYAAMWTGERKPWTIVSGSAESGLYKSVDGGDRWVKLAGGLPQGVVGKIGVAVSPADPGRVWALVEAA
ncbi:MAG TPA: glycosyl hydrolase, partial [Thermoanaerobaculia bacterium]|nr:glycosyl hydrolase [Thermoanaerobaculia bacterium]